MPRRSAGLLPYRIAPDGSLELFLVHPGGPLWARREEGAWSVAKGEYRADEAAEAAAEREFAEELGTPAPDGVRVDLGEVTQTSGKVVRVWAIDAPDFDVEHVVSNQFEMEWPPRSGQIGSFPEVDRSEWTTAALARIRLITAQSAFVDRLSDLLGLGEGGPVTS